MLKHEITETAKPFYDTVNNCKANCHVQVNVRVNSLEPSSKLVEWSPVTIGSRIPATDVMGGRSKTASPAYAPMLSNSFSISTVMCEAADPTNSVVGLTVRSSGGPPPVNEQSNVT